MERGDSLILDFGEHITGTFSIDMTSIGSPVDAPLYIAVKFCEMACEMNYPHLIRSSDVVSF